MGTNINTKQLYLGFRNIITVKERHGYITTVTITTTSDNKGINNNNNNQLYTVVYQLYNVIQQVRGYLSAMNARETFFK